MAFNKYIMMSKILFVTLANGPGDRSSPGPLPHFTAGTTSGP